MITSVQAPALKLGIKSVVLDIIAIAFIYLMPILSHLLSFPMYFIEPMRIMVILAMIHTHRNNAYILALTLPLFSFVVAMHPVFIKSLLIAVELAFMVAVFQVLYKKIHVFAAIFVSIWASKLFYYALKFVAIATLMPGESMVGIALYIQLITSIIMSLYVFYIFGYKRQKQTK